MSEDLKIETGEALPEAVKFRLAFVEKAWPKIGDVIQSFTEEYVAEHPDSPEDGQNTLVALQMLVAHLVNQLVVPAAKPHICAMLVNGFLKQTGQTVQQDESATIQ